MQTPNFYYSACMVWDFQAKQLMQTQERLNAIWSLRNPSTIKSSQDSMKKIISTEDE